MEADKTDATSLENYAKKLHKFGLQPGDIQPCHLCESEHVLAGIHSYDEVEVRCQACGLMLLERWFDDEDQPVIPDEQTDREQYIRLLIKRVVGRWNNKGKET